MARVRKGQHKYLGVFLGKELRLVTKDIPIEKLVPNPHPMRSDLKLTRDFISDIRKEGVSAPLIVRPLRGDREGMFEIVTGMRRYESALKVGLKKLPCIIEELSDEESYYEIIRENIHRKDVNPADVAKFFRRGIIEMEISTQRIAESLSKDRAEIEKWLRIADAPDIMARLKEEKMTKEHAFEILRALDELDGLRRARRLTIEAAQRLRIDIVNYASRATVTLTKRFISNQLREYKVKTPPQTSLLEAIEELSPHDLAEERLSADFASKGALVEKISLHPDLVVRLSSELRSKYGCDYLWVEVVDTSPPTQEKITKLLQILGSNWRILVYDLRSDTETLYPEDEKAQKKTRFAAK